MASITIDKKDARLGDVRFLVSAMDVKDDRFHTKNFKVKAGLGLATDGKRLHWVEEIALEDGFYVVHVRQKAKVTIEKMYELDTNEGGFPDCEDIIALPDTKPIAFNPENVSRTYTKVIRAMSGTTIDVSFVTDICNHLGDRVGEFYVEEPDKEGHTDKPVRFVAGNRRAAVMPLYMWL